MTPEETATHTFGFREWLTHYERQQEEDRERFNQLANIVTSLGGQVSKLSANMETLIDNQRGLFSRMNRPWQWGVVVAVFAGLFTVGGVFGTILALSLDPMKDQMNDIQAIQQRETARNLELHMWFRDSIEDIKEGDAAREVDLEWLKKMEERQYELSHYRPGGNS